MESAKIPKQLKIGTRASLLAITQTKLVIDAIKELNPNLEIESIQINTQGDKKQGLEAAKFGDKKDWVYELEQALIKNEIDIAVHSAKDVPGVVEPELARLPVLERESPFDIFIGKKLSDGKRIKFSKISKDATIGTSSIRRRSSLLNYNPDFNIVDHRGNVNTRISKLDGSNDLSGIILAEAGVKRISALKSTEYEVIDPKIMLPAMNQGILCAEFRKDDLDIKELILKLSSDVLKAIFITERELAYKLEGDCRSAIGSYAEVNDSKITLHAKVLHPLGLEYESSSVSADVKDYLQVIDNVFDELSGKNIKRLLK